MTSRRSRPSIWRSDMVPRSALLLAAVLAFARSAAALPTVSFAPDRDSRADGDFSPVWRRRIDPRAETARVVVAAANASSALPVLQAAATSKA